MAFIGFEGCKYPGGMVRHSFAENNSSFSSKRTEQREAYASSRAASVPAACHATSLKRGLFKFRWGGEIAKHLERWQSGLMRRS